MKRHHLDATPRSIDGKKVKDLRRSGLLPVGVYGKGMESLSLQVKSLEFASVFSETGKTGLIDLRVEANVYPVLVKNVQIHPVKGNVEHVEFHKVNLSEKIKAGVPIELIGESPAVLNQVGILLQTLNEVEVEALPANLPEKIEVNVATLSELDQQLAVGDLPKILDVEVLTGVEEIVVKVVPAVSAQAQADAEAAAEVGTAGESGETVETSKPEDSESPPDVSEEKTKQ